VTNPQGPPNDGPSRWARPGNQGPFGPPPTERPTERIRTGGPGPGPHTPPPQPPREAQTEQIHARPTSAARPGYQPPHSTATGQTERIATTAGEPPAGAKKKKRRGLRDPLSIVLILIIVFALLIAGLIGGELYVRHVADSKVAQAVACEVKDQATASFGVAPLLLWQIATQHFTNLSVTTAGNQVRDAKGMKLDINVKNVQLRDSANSKGTVGSVDATVTWTTDGIKESVQNAIPVLGPFVTSSVTTHPSDGTIELKGMLDNITAKPTVSGNGIELQIVTFNALGFTMPRESVQSTLDEFLSKQTQNFPLGIKADNVQVNSTGVVAHFSTQNANIPAGDNNDPCFANI